MGRTYPGSEPDAELEEIAGCLPDNLILLSSRRDGPVLYVTTLRVHVACSSEVGSDRRTHHYGTDCTDCGREMFGGGPAEICCSSMVMEDGSRMNGFCRTCCPYKKLH